MIPAPRPRSAATRLALMVCAALVFTGFFALGTWQLKRLQWKLDLIARVEQRVHAPAVAAPGRDSWPQINAESDEYRHVRLIGTFLYELTTQVQASTELGSGFWQMTPLLTADGSVVLVNRGFVTTKERERVESAGFSVAVVTGLLRISEPGGGYLRSNDPAADRWYSRDVQAIAAARGLSQVAPYFVDADAAKAPVDGAVVASPSTHPIGGLTVIAFHNNHLVYALTWYALALMVAGACFWVVREERRSRRRGADTRVNGIDQESEDGRQN
ncbi:SURF1 family protein [Paraherbaspirillum soli]|uniref:SURF1-like protein n=1 Tax=Paraherbaspirillum soli TaxID=631222 RepID=A0ABW0MBM1_9BURK